MAEFTALSIHDGVGIAHMNRFRICMRPNGGREGQIASNLLSRMPTYMDGNTASVVMDKLTWHGSPTLKFRGVAEFRPFNVPIVVPILITPLPVTVPVPQRVRDFMIPDIHTDQVGIIDTSSTGFTVQTLKRNYEDENDKNIRHIIAGSLTFTGVPGLVLTKWLGDVAVYINQHHFLAGRRSFRFAHGSKFGYSDDRFVFETAAIERFSSIVYEKSQIFVGDIAPVLRKVWVQMVNKFCRSNGYDPIKGEQAGVGWTKADPAVHCMQTEVDPSVAAIMRNPHWPEMNKTHPFILEP